MTDIVEIEEKQKQHLEMLRKSAISKYYIKYSISLLLDASGSMSGKKIEDAKEALIHFLKTVNLEENEVGLVIFGGVEKTCNLTQNYNLLVKEINSVYATGNTPMFKAIKNAYDILSNKTNPIMVIATDGQPTDAKEEEILEYSDIIKNKGVRIITIGIGEDVNKNFLKKLCSSEEDYHFAKASFELKKIYKEVANNILSLPLKSSYKDKKEI